MPRPSATQVRPGVEHDPKVPGLQLRHRATRSSWHLWYRLDGREHRPKIGDARVVTRAQARQIALQWLAEAAAGRHPRPDQDRRTVADLRRRYDEIHAPRKKPRSQAEDARLWAMVLPAIGSRDVTKVTTADIGDLHHSLRQTPYQANRVTALLHKAFNLAIRWGWRQDNPVRVERYREQKRRRVPTADETRRLLDAVDAMRQEQPWFAGMVELLIFTGCRLREIADARWEYFRDGALHLPDSKTGAKVIPLNEPAREALARIPRIVGNPYIIAGKGRRPIVAPQKRWRDLLASAGIADLRIHDLRRLYVSTSLSAGIPLDQIGQVVGHASIATTRGYAYLQTDAARLAAEMAGEVFTRLRKRNPAEAG
jgi:integrase